MNAFMILTVRMFCRKTTRTLHLEDHGQIDISPKVWNKFTHLRTLVLQRTSIAESVVDLRFLSLLENVCCLLFLILMK